MALRVKYKRVEVTDSEVKAVLQIPDLVIPKEDFFKGYLRAEQIKDLKEDQIQTLLRFSVFEQWNDWQIQTLADLWQNVQTLEEKLAKQEILNAKLKQIQTAWNFLKWTGVTIGAALLSATARWIVGQ